MIHKCEYGSVDLTLKDKTKIGLSFSGGTNSTLLLYLLSKQLDSDYEIVPIVFLSSSENTNRLIEVQAIIDKIKTLFPKVNITGIISKTYEFSCNAVNDKTDDDKTEIDPFTKQPVIPHFYHRRQLALELTRQNKIDVFVRGITSNVPHDMLHEFGAYDNRRPDRDDRISRDFVKRSWEDGTEVTFYTPLSKIDKRYIKQMYINEGILDTLLPMTRSCVNVNTDGTPCENCHWCKIRKGIFGNYR